MKIDTLKERLNSLKEQVSDLKKADDMFDDPEDMDEDEIAYGFATAVEEGMEMIGALMFLAVNLFEMRKADRVHVVVSAE